MCLVHKKGRKPRGIQPSDNIFTVCINVLQPMKVSGAILSGYYKHYAASLTIHFSSPRFSTLFSACCIFTSAIAAPLCALS